MPESSSGIIGNDEELTLKSIGLYDRKQIFILAISKVLEMFGRDLFNRYHLNWRCSRTRCPDFTAALERTKSCVYIPWTLYLRAGRMLLLRRFNLSF
jgi:hypothetical protein